MSSSVSARGAAMLLATAIILTTSSAAFAQDETANPDGSTTIDILASADDLYGPPPPQEDQCTDEQDAATISREIIVCRRSRDRRQFQTTSREGAQDRYAEETMNEGNPKTPDFILDCNDQGWPVGCVRFGKVPPKAYMIDFSALPETPPGSDAERAGRGLAPTGYEGGDQQVAAENPAINPEESASPAEEP